MKKPAATTQTSLFRNNVSDMAFFTDALRDELLKKLAHLIEFTRLTLFISGEPGTGKTSLLKQRFIKTRKENWQVSIIDANFCRTQNQLLKQLNKDWSIQADNLNAAVNHIKQLKQGGLIPIMVIDNTDNMAGEVLQSTAGLLTACREELRVVLFGRQLKPEIDQSLGSSDNEDEALIMMSLDPLSENDTGAYIKHILAHMKITDSPLLSNSVLHQIYQSSKGIFPRINTQANRILKHGLSGEDKPTGNATNGLKLIALALLVSVIGSLLFGNGDDEIGLETEESEQLLQTLALPPQEGLADKPPATTRASVSINPRMPAPPEETIVDNAAEKIENRGAPPAESKPPPPAREITIAGPEQPRPAAGGMAGDAIRGAEWLLQQDPSAYTLQLVASSRKDKIIAFIRRHGIEAQAAYFRTLRKGKDWYSLVYGIYPSRAEAVAASKNLPGNLKDIKPWIRRIEDIHKKLQS